MEVNFSQFGQNIAASDVVSTETENKSELQSVVVDQMSLNNRQKMIKENKTLPITMTRQVKNR